MTGRPREPASLIAGTGVLRILRRTSGDSDTLGLDNGGDSGSAYLEGFLSASQLLDPFTLCASTRLSPYPGSLNPASRATIPDRSFSHSITNSIPHFIWKVKTHERRNTRMWKETLEVYSVREVHRILYSFA